MWLVKGQILEEGPLEENIEFERCIEFLVRMIEKYGDEVVKKHNKQRFGFNDKSILEFEKNE